MTTKTTQVTEPATPDTGAAVQVTEPGRTPSVHMIYVQDTNTGNKLPNPVPENWLRRFKNLKQVPSDKAATKTTQKGGK